MHPAADVTYLLRRAVVRRASCRSCTLLVQLQKTRRQELAYYDEAVESARVRLRSGDAAAELPAPFELSLLIDEFGKSQGGVISGGRRIKLEGGAHLQIFFLHHPQL
jgi:hypothetical protein